MARTRSLKPSFFKNEHLAECEPMARLLFAGLWTLADSQGRLECRPLRIKAELFPYDNCDIVALLGQLELRRFRGRLPRRGSELPRDTDVHRTPAMPPIRAAKWHSGGRLRRNRENSRRAGKNNCGLRLISFYL
jgi:hypothetical protein